MGKIENDPDSLLNQPIPMTEEEIRYNKVKMGVDKLPSDAHVGRFTSKRKAVGYVSPRRKYQSTYYQKNKEKIQERRRDRYARSEAVRNFHKEANDKWRAKVRKTKGKVNRTVLQGENGEQLFSARYASAAFGYSARMFRLLCERGIIPKATFRDKRGWRLYTAKQVALLKRAKFYYEGADPWQVQSILFAYWNNPEDGLSLTAEKMVKEAIKKIPRKKLKNNNY